MTLVRWTVVATAIGAALPHGAPAATYAPITGQLSRPGYTVLAVTTSGRATAFRASGRSFRIVPLQGRVTLHLRAPNGVYAGPIVVGRSGSRAILGIRAGTRLGMVVINSRRGYAKPRRPVSRRRLDVRLYARARNGIAIGAGRFGLVRSRPPRNAVVLGDQDADGVPDVIDIDDDGDLVLDKLDKSTRARASVVSDEFHLQSNLTLDVSQTANVDAPGFSEARMEQMFSSFGVLQMGIIPGDSSELDCAQPQTRTDPALRGLSYCTTGGTGRLMAPGLPLDGLAFPAMFDPDNDGFGTMTPSNPGPAPGSGQRGMFLRHGATADRIGTGDLLIQRVTRSGVESQYPGTIQYMFATVPALVRYDDGHGNAMDVPYPIQSPDPGPGGPGTRGNGLPVTAPGNSDVVVTLTVWRPQRRPIPPETGSWIDIGGLNYSASFAEIGARGCPQSAFTPVANVRPLVAADVLPAAYFGVRDLAPDAAANPANTFSFELNLSECARAANVSFRAGETQSLWFNALTPNGTDSALQTVAFARR